VDQIEKMVIIERRVWNISKYFTAIIEGEILSSITVPLAVLFQLAS
jgi:hypothetical protein